MGDLVRVRVLPIGLYIIRKDNNEPWKTSMEEAAGIEAKSIQRVVITLEDVETGKCLDIFTDYTQLPALFMAHQNIQGARPLFHEVMHNALKTMHVSVRYVIVDGFYNNIYSAGIYLSNGYKVDARPSDAIPLALYCGAPVLVLRSLLDMHGYMPESDEEMGLLGDGSSEDGVDTVAGPFEILQQQMQQAIEEENYERAAELRDEIEKLEQEEHSDEPDDKTDPKD